MPTAQKNQLQHHKGDQALSPAFDSGATADRATQRVAPTNIYLKRAFNPPLTLFNPNSFRRVASSLPTVEPFLGL